MDDFSSDSSFAEKIVLRVLSLDKAFAKLGDKEARAQHKIVRQAERLYLKAAEAAGNNAIQKMILSQVPELEEELTGMNEEKMQVSVQIRENNLVRIKNRSTHVSEGPALIARAYEMDASNNSITQNSEKSTETTEKDLKNEKKVQMSLAEAANQQTSEDIDEVKKGLRMNCTKRGRTTASFRLLYTKLYKMQILYN